MLSLVIKAPQQLEKLVRPSSLSLSEVVLRCKPRNKPVCPPCPALWAPSSYLVPSMACSSMILSFLLIQFTRSHSQTPTSCFYHLPLSNPPNTLDHHIPDFVKVSVPEWLSLSCRSLTGGHVPCSSVQQLRVTLNLT